MSRQITTTVYTFDELSDKAKEKARDWYRNGALDYDWWDCTIDDFVTIAETLGFTVKTRDKQPCVWFSGFSSQGDGACFEGTFHAKDVKESALTEYLGNLDLHPDKELIRIAKEFFGFAKDHPTFYGSLSHTGRYSHKYSVSYACEEITETDEDTTDILTVDTQNEFEERCRDLMEWLYRTLEKEHDYLLSDEQVDETIRINEYTFTESGEREG